MIDEAAAPAVPALLAPVRARTLRSTVSGAEALLFSLERVGLLSRNLTAKSALTIAQLGALRIVKTQSTARGFSERVEVIVADDGGRFPVYGESGALSAINRLLGARNDPRRVYSVKPRDSGAETARAMFCSPETARQFESELAGTFALEVAEHPTPGAGSPETSFSDPCLALIASGVSWSHVRDA